MNYIKILTVLYSIKIIPLLYAYLYEVFKKIPYPDFIDAMTMLVLAPPLFISEFTGATWLMRSNYDPSIIGIIVSLIIWLIIDADIASLITLLYFGKV
ncbi:MULTISPECIES: hypothetical protein [unclassified Oceanispirochaeta]|uniref:hypothetical protein n=1 Tax=unclassified Oceanispirochaeta TaxID=2635722 RepID=UPI000E08DD34|nr:MULTISPECIES: hypothetical protein [unclassified Oceanispirochaeta]MBF9018816.1 hypothetical protein [Oceanispirochaeta sp. M2]NPD75285.1 hypothetical protein [Oceanispirochaeta sp. M1]RDG28875.1 hypothetical protein DV872_24640 [Oceanispirochaeta sp. M1]